MASDVADAAAEFVGRDLGSRVVFDDDEVRPAFHIADGDAAMWLHGVTSQGHFVVIRRRRTADRENLNLTKRHIVIAGSNQHTLLASVPKLHGRVEFIDHVPSRPGDIRLAAKRLGQDLLQIANLSQDREQSGLSLISIARALFGFAMNQPIEEFDQLVRQIRAVGADIWEPSKD